MEKKPLVRYLRLAQIAVSVVVLLLVAMLLISSIGTLANSSIQSSLASSNERYMLIRADYSIYNPGPIPLSPLTIKLQVNAPDGRPLTSPSANSIAIGPFSRSSGTLYFNLTLLPNAAQDLNQLLQGGKQPVVTAEVTSSMAGIVTFTLILSSYNGG